MKGRQRSSPAYQSLRRADQDGPARDPGEAVSEPGKSDTGDPDNRGEDALLQARLEEAEAQDNFHRLSTTTPLTMAVLAVVVSVYVGLYSVAVAWDMQEAASRKDFSNLMVDRTLTITDQLAEAQLECTRAQLAATAPAPIDLETVRFRDLVRLSPRELKRAARELKHDTLADQACRRVDEQLEVLDAVSGDADDVPALNFSSRFELLGLGTFSALLVLWYLRRRSRLHHAAEKLATSRRRRMELERAEERKLFEPPPPTRRRWRTT
jgi:hypothetical protein